ncbi:MAG: exodeoxyribonuclease VII large subunit [Eubacterium sp.]|nr:exodeoxyribonuclease VII large subunit [Eubacterium sp.]
MESIYSVAQVNNYIKNMFEQDFVLKNIYIKGEVSNCKYHSSGHIYFSLKDKSGVIQAVMFAGNRRGLQFQMEEGQTVIVFGSVSVYERDGKYQIYARRIELEGRGLLYQRFEQLKQDLEDMGLFDPMYKKKIPAYAMKIGICTAKTGAAIQDIRTVSKRRNPYVSLYLYPCLVQGEGAAQDIVNGIRCLDEMGLDVIIVGRGGGSIEDLWAFNEEIVAKAIFNCNTPIISAVGHETDVTIADFVADQRAATPSAAAELANFEYGKFMEDCLHRKQMLYQQLRSRLELAKRKTESLENQLGRFSPQHQLLTKKQYLADLQELLERTVHDRLDTMKSQIPEMEGRILELHRTVFLNRKQELALLAEKLKGLSPLEKISKGFAYVEDGTGKPLASVEQVQPESKVNMILRDGKITAKVLEVEGEEYGREE